MPPTSPRKRRRIESSSVELEEPPSYVSRRTGAFATATAPAASRAAPLRKRRIISEEWEENENDDDDNDDDDDEDDDDDDVQEVRSSTVYAGGSNGDRRSSKGRARQSQQQLGTRWRRQEALEHGDEDEEEGDEDDNEEQGHSEDAYNQPRAVPAVPPDAEQAREEEEEESEEMQEKRRIWEDFQDEYFDSELGADHLGRHNVLCCLPTDSLHPVVDRLPLELVRNFELMLERDEQARGAFELQLQLISPGGTATDAGSPRQPSNTACKACCSSTPRSLSKSRIALHLHGKLKLGDSRPQRTPASRLRQLLKEMDKFGEMSPCSRQPPMTMSGAHCCLARSLAAVGPRPVTQVQQQNRPKLHKICAGCLPRSTSRPRPRSAQQKTRSHWRRPHTTG